MKERGLIMLITRPIKRTIKHRISSATIVAAESFQNFDFKPFGGGLHYADLSYTDLRGADLSGLSVISADFSGADLRGADLRGADLRCSVFFHTDLRGADLRGADLRNADLRNTWLSDTNIQDVTWPLDLTPLSKEQEENNLRIVSALALSSAESLDMISVHTCETVHCMAGWACHALHEGPVLEAKYSWWLAGFHLLGADAAQMFHASEEEATIFLKQYLVDSVTS